ncbi:MAG: hypothetical protein IT374_07165 [Polyangiaceae bacterium]|nr:hypothetical protein [Polyangiaceae bacterium]
MEHREPDDADVAIVALLRRVRAAHRAEAERRDLGLAAAEPLDLDEPVRRDEVPALVGAAGPTVDDVEAVDGDDRLEPHRRVVAHHDDVAVARLADREQPPARGVARQRAAPIVAQRDRDRAVGDGDLRAVERPVALLRRHRA